MGTIRSLREIKWEEAPFDKNNINKLVQEHNISELLGRLLNQLGLDHNKIEFFLNPKVKNIIPDPFHLLDMSKGVDFVVNKVLEKKNICIYGDYDVDGATSSALLKNYFRSIGVETFVYIPNRFEDGYGPNVKIFDMLKNQYHHH